MLQTGRVRTIEKSTGCGCYLVQQDDTVFGVNRKDSKGNDIFSHRHKVANNIGGGVGRDKSDYKY